MGKDYDYLYLVVLKRRLPDPTRLCTTRPWSDHLWLGLSSRFPVQVVP